ncbi:uncharacterized protein LOC125039333 [Penaeus chinensis]|uniref:uncharacterized protein LOC125039333 n=1 Tax=Penaeus chinensis TaxID=139456 RepID=UPI001FB79777|nr:uncharacterized protein LOC125039333 [Penaeus chinensis]
MINGKAVASDSIPVEVWKCLGKTGVEYLTREFNIMNIERIPEQWRISTNIPIFKNKGDILACGNFRGIKLMCHSMKIYERIHDKCLRGIVEISNEQFAFMKNKSITDAIFVLRQLQEKFVECEEDLHQCS